MENAGDRITYFAETDYRNKRQPFGIRADDRARHVYVIGKTGMGKSTLLENMAIQDIRNGEGIAFVDPHGKTAETLLEYVPKERINDVLYFAPFDTEYPVSFNIMEDVGYDKRHLVANGLLSAFRKIWVDAWSSRMEYILNNTILALLEYPGSTLLSVNRMYTDKEFRKRVVENITDPSVKSFWEDEFSKYTDRYTQEATPAIQNKVGQFTANPIVRNIIGQPKSSFDFRQMLDNRKIVIINLSKGRIGEGNANLLGSMLITKLYLAAMSRADLPDSEVKKLPQFNLFVDEFQSFANESFSDILSEARKYKLALTIAHQYIEQMPEEVRSAVFGNVGTMVMFRVGAYDAEVLEKEFEPAFTAQDMVNLGFTQVYLKLMINGVTSHPFSAVTLPPIPPPEQKYRDEAFLASRKQFANPRDQVEQEITEWYHTSFEERKEQLASEEKPQQKQSAPRKQAGDQKRTHPKQEAQEHAPRKKAPRKTPQPHEGEQKEESQSKEHTKGQEAVSLSTLAKGKKKQAAKKKPDRGPSKEHLESLRSALAGALQETEQEHENASEQNTSQNTEETSTAEQPQTASQSGSRSTHTNTHTDQTSGSESAQTRTEETSHKNRNEIPEHELRQMLQVDEDEK